MELTNEEKEKALEDLLDTMVSAMIYVDVKTQAHNKFVRRLGGENQEAEALSLLIRNLNDCVYLMPLVDDLTKRRMAKIKAENDIEQPELPFEKG